MILSYSKPEFVDLILLGKKIHTIREDAPQRWKAGREIQHWLGNPRNVHAKNKPREFLKGVCFSVQSIKIECMDRSNWGIYYRVWIDGKAVSCPDCSVLAENDGLTSDEFSLWFLKGQDVFVGKIIHFTDLRY